MVALFRVPTGHVTAHGDLVVDMNGGVLHSRRCRSECSLTWREEDLGGAMRVKVWAAKAKGTVRFSQWRAIFIEAAANDLERFGIMLLFVHHA